jgi:predicted Zn-dependent protease with MMP-like domain
LPFGIYAGASCLDEAGDAALLEPPRIVLFPKTFYEFCESERVVRDEIRITLWHEIAHRLGFQESDMPDELL